MLRKLQFLVMASLLGMFFLLPLAEASPSQLQEQQKEACLSYSEFLTGMINNPDSYFTANSCDVPLKQALVDNYFAMSDIDGDGIQELLLDFSNHFSGKEVQMIVFKYNASIGTIEESGIFQSCGGKHFQDPDPEDNYFWSIVPLEDNDYAKGYFATKFFNNGYVFTCDSYQNSYGKSIWPFSIYKFDDSKYKYVHIYIVNCLDSMNWKHSDSFPYAEDYDYDGVIYHFKEYGVSPMPLTLTEYKNAINNILNGAKEVIPTWYPITLSGIQQASNNINQTNNQVNVYVNGQKVEFDQQPIYYNDRILVPVRAISEALGAKLLWDSKSKTVNITKGGKVILMTVGSKQVSVNGQPKLLDIDPINSGGRVLVPLRFVSENLDCQVTWEGNTKTVKIAQ